jgi:hypothetical protein
MEGHPSPRGGPTLPLSAATVICRMTEDDAEMKLKISLIQAMRRNGGAGARVTIKNFVAAAELVKHDQAQCFDDLGGRLYVREPRKVP